MLDHKECTKELPQQFITEVPCRISRPSQLMSIPGVNLIAISKHTPLESGTVAIMFGKTKFQLTVVPGFSSVQMLNPWLASLAW
jgi:hypothetical protein